jgi:hypothetical protein
MYQDGYVPVKLHRRPVAHSVPDLFGCRGLTRLLQEETRDCVNPDNETVWCFMTNWQRIGAVTASALSCSLSWQARRSRANSPKVGASADKLVSFYAPERAAVPAAFSYPAEDVEVPTLDRTSLPDIAELVAGDSRNASASRPSASAARNRPKSRRAMS